MSVLALSPLPLLACALVPEEQVAWPMLYLVPTGIVSIASVPSSCQWRMGLRTGAAHQEYLRSLAGKLCTRAAPPLPPDPPHMGVQAAAANALQLAWSAPWANGAPVTSYALDMARADALPSQSQSGSAPAQVPTPLQWHLQEAHSNFGCLCTLWLKSHFTPNHTFLPRHSLIILRG